MEHRVPNQVFDAAEPPAPRRRRPAIPQWLTFAFCLATVAAIAVFLHYFTLNQSYGLSPAETKLLSATSVDTGKVSFKAGVLNYNQQHQAKDGQQQMTVAGSTNSTSQDSYQVTLASKVSDGIQFSNSDSSLPFKLVPITSTGNGRYLNGRMVYPSDGATNVYTLRRNGIKEDIILNQAPGDSFSYSWKLELGSQLQARLASDGSVGIYSANPLLSGSNLQIGDAKSQALIDNARQNGAKASLVYMIPAPYIKDSQGNLSTQDVRFSLNGNVLTLTATNLTSSGKHYPLSIDPTLVTTTTADFRTGVDDGNIDYSTADEIDRGNISLGKVGTWAYTHNGGNDGTTFSAGFTQPRYSFTSVVYNGYMYVLGGNSDASGNDCTSGSGFSYFCNGVQFAPINSNGTIGTWHYTHNSTDDGTTFSAGFTQPRDLFTAAVYNGYMYVLGGNSGTTSSNDCTTGSSPYFCNGVQFAPINSNGTIGTWHYTHNSTDDGTTFSAGFTQPRNNFATTVYNGYLYVLGGARSSSSDDCDAGFSVPMCNGVQFAPINANGTIGTWNYTYNGGNNGTTFVGGFPLIRDGLTAVAYNGYLYIAGGYCSGIAGLCGGATPNYFNDVRYAPINANGTIGAWNSTSSFTEPRYAASSVAYNGYLYVIGGYNSVTAANDCGVAGFCNGVQFAPINSNGTIGAWHYTHASTDDGTTFSAGFTQPRTGDTAAVYNGYMYVMGGEAGASANDCTTGSSDFCNGVQYLQINTGTPTFGTDGTWNYTHNSTNDGATFSAGFASPRADQTTVAYNGYLYILGGTAGSSANDCTTGVSFYCNGVQFAPINTDGTIGAWHYTHASTDDGTTFVAGFINARYLNTTVAYNGYLYVMGGATTGTSANDCTGGWCNGVQFAPINANGTIGAWHYTHASTDDGTTFVAGFKTARSQFTSVAYNGYLYITGGRSAFGTDDCTTGPCNGVQFAPINSNGTIGAWHFTSAGADNGTTFSAGFTDPRYGHTTVAYNGYLYVTGGSNGTSTNDCANGTGYCNGVQFAPINSNGTIGAWHYTHASTDDGTTFVAGFNTARYEFTSVAYNGYLYVIGGQSGSLGDCVSTPTLCSGVQFAPINSNGTIGVWHYTHAGTDDGTTFSAGFNSPRSDHTTAVYNGYLYVIGGESSSGINDCPTAFCGGVQFTSMNSPEQAATYEKTIDMGGSALITGISFNGRAVCGMRFNYSFADSSGVFGAIQTITYGLPGVTYSINPGSAERYIWVQFKMDDAVCGTRSQITDFTITYNVVPAAPTLSSPSSGATGVSALPTFQLKTTDADSDYLRYKVLVCANSGCSSVITTADQTASQTGWSGQDQQGSTAYTGSSTIGSSTMANFNYQLPPLAKNTQYWWQAYAIDPGGTNTWSPVSATQTFTTGDDSPAPPVLVYPITTSNGNSVSTTFQLRSTENNGDYLHYWIDVCADNLCGSIIRTICQTNTGSNLPSATCSSPSQTGWSGQDQQAGTAYTGSPSITLSQMAILSYQAPYLTKNTQYWWRGYAIDPGGSNTWSSASAISTFTTAPTETHIQGNIKFQGNVKL